MRRAIVVRGTLSGPSRIELDEPVTELRGQVEVVLQAVPTPGSSGEDVFDVIASLKGGTRTKADIDGQIAEERDAWADR